MFNFYRYEVFGTLDKDIVKFCKDNYIGCSASERCCYFVGNKEDLQKLHNEFFNEYEFNIEEVNLKGTTNK
jgi:hypothetical protein